MVGQKETQRKEWIMTKAQKLKAQGLALLATGSTVGDVVEITGVSPRTVYRWIAVAGQNGYELADIVRRNAALKAEGAFLAKLENYMEIAITTSSQHLEMSQSYEWFEKQSPEKLAIFHGVHIDKVIWILDALARREQEDS